MPGDSGFGEAGARVASHARVNRLHTLVLLVVLLGQAGSAMGAPVRTRKMFAGAGWRAPNGVRVPIGLKRELFERLIDQVRTDPAFADAEAVVLYGSRTHHLYGYEPTPTSDLDVRVYWKGSATQHQQTVEKAVRANGVMEPVAKAAGFPIEQQIIKFGELDEHLAPKIAIDFTPHSLANESAMWKQLLDEGAHRGPRNDMKFAFQKKVTSAAEWHALGKEAIIVLRDEAATARRLTQLRARDYRNVIVLNGGTGGP
jgi:hypothetical protein